MHVVVVGGGFGGIKTAIELSKDKSFQITLISDLDHFAYHAVLYATATGKSRDAARVPLAAIFTDRPNVKVVQDTITSVNPTRRIVVGAKKHYSYDSLVLALGVVTTYFGIEGLDTYSYGIKTLDEVDRFKQHLHDELVADKHVDKNYVIVGAGPTGVELAAALTTYIRCIASAHQARRAKLRVTLVEAAPRVLPRCSEIASEVVSKRLKQLGVTVLTGKKVESQDADGIMVNGHKLESHTVVWTSGVTNHPFFKNNSQWFELAANGRIVVDSHLSAYQDVYVIGDNAATPYSGVAKTALGDGAFVARNLRLSAQNRAMKPYQPSQPATTVPVGRHWALFEYRNVHFGGFIGAMLRRAFEFNGANSILPLGLAIKTWWAANVPQEQCDICKGDDASAIPVHETHQ